MNAWLSVVGIGAEGLEGLSPAARSLVDSAEVLVGGARHLAMVANGTAERLTWTRPLSDTVREIRARRGRRVVVLASGDPMWFGIGVTLARSFSRDEIAIHPYLSAFGLAAARMGWPLGDVETITLHGRLIELLALYLAPGARLLVLSENGQTPARVAAFLRARGWGPSEVTVLECLDGAGERRVDGIAESWKDAPYSDLNTLAIRCIPGAEARIFSRAPGLPDEAFSHDGQITKREIRALTLSALSPLPGQLLWDVGAGCGSVSIEWMRAARGARAAAVERDRTRRDLIARNAATLGVPNLRIVEGEAPAVLSSLDPPDAVFIGGSVSNPEIAEIAWKSLKPGGRLVANAVTIEGENAIATWQGRLGGELTRIAVGRMEAIGSLRGWRPLMPVTQWRLVKPHG